MAKNNYQRQKDQKDQAKKRKKAEKLQRKHEKGGAEADVEDVELDEYGMPIPGEAEETADGESTVAEN